MAVMGSFGLTGPREKGCGYTEETRLEEHVDVISSKRRINGVIESNVLRFQSDEF